MKKKFIFFLMFLVTQGYFMYVNSYQKSFVERQFLQKSKHNQTQYPGEHVPVIEVKNCVELGKLTALRFLEWVAQNPQGVIALPTGKTPEYFIKFLTYYREYWNTPLVQQELKQFGILSQTFPDTSELKFVQIDEFYPIDPQHKNSFYRYIKQYYLSILDLKPENVLLIDPSKIDDIETFCKQYEENIQAWGGIGFFLGGIGPDGHIAFNMRGSAHDSTTRLVHLNYESAASAAISLGGMEYARDKTAITIGLDTITRNPDASIIIIAAGEGKAPLVAAAVEKEKSVQRPASILQGKKNACFYITQGASCRLSARKLLDLNRISDLDTNPQLIDEILAEVSLNVRKPIHLLTVQDIEQTARGKILCTKCTVSLEFLQASSERFKTKIEFCLRDRLTNKSMFHTAPHHDDVMLSYYPAALALLRDNKNHFVYATSGFNAVTNLYLTSHLKALDTNFLQTHAKEIFDTTYDDILALFTEAFSKGSHTKMTRYERIIIAHKLIDIFKCNTIESLEVKINWICDCYLPNIRPGEKDHSDIQKLKGSIRESEVDRMWAINNIGQNQITHLRSRFYTGDYFTPQPTYQYDVSPVITLLNETQPDIVTLAFDPEGTGPDTHYKVLQMVADALHDWKQNGHEPKVWGYRNVWYRFKPSQATRMIPVSVKEQHTLHDVFISCFSTQKEASFPAHQFDGPFSGYSLQIQKEQLAMMRTILGDEYFDQHPDATIRTANGLIFLQEMTTDEFLQEAKELKEHIEVID